MKKHFLGFAAAAALAFSGAAHGAIVINEINSDSFNTPTTDYLEYVELYSTTGTTTDLSGLTLLLINGNGDVVYGGGGVDLDGQFTDANGYYVFASTAVGGDNTTLLGAGNILQNGQDAVAVVTGDATSYPNGTLITNAIIPSLVDAIVYGTGDADDTGLLTALGETIQFDEGGVSPPNDPADFSLSRIPNGVDGNNFQLAPRTPDAVNVIPEPSTISLLGLAALRLLARRR